MSVATEVEPVPDAPAQRRTPARMRRWLLSVVLTAMALLATTSLLMSRAQDQVRTIGTEAAPQAATASESDPDRLAEVLSDFFDPDDTQEAVVVQDRDAVPYTGLDSVGLSWEHAPGQWVALIGSTEDGLRADDLHRYAEQLGDEPMPVPPPFTFDLLPPGVSPSWINQSGMELSTPEDAPDSYGNIMVTLDEDDLDVDDDDAAAAEPVQVGRHQGYYVDDPYSGSASLSLRLEDGTVLNIYTDGTLRLRRDDLILLANGIQVTPHAEPDR